MNNHMFNCLVSFHLGSSSLPYQEYKKSSLRSLLTNNAGSILHAELLDSLGGCVGGPDGGCANVVVTGLRDGVQDAVTAAGACTCMFAY